MEAPHNNRTPLQFQSSNFENAIKGLSFNDIENLSDDKISDIFQKIELPDLTKLINSYDKKFIALADRLYKKDNLSPDEKYKIEVQHNNVYKIEAAMLARFKDSYDFTKDGNTGFILLASYGYTDIVRELLKNKDIDPTANYNAALSNSCADGYAEVVKLLLTDGRANPAAGTIFISACIRGHSEVVKLLLDDGRANPAILNNHALIVSCQQGQADVVKLLLADKRINPSDGNDQALTEASFNGKTEVVRLLLADGRVNPSVNNDEAIKSASAHGDFEIVELLLGDPRVNPSVDNNVVLRNLIARGKIEGVGILLSDEKVLNTLTDDDKRLIATLKDKAK